MIKQTKHMPCELEEDDIVTFPGVTLFTKRGARCIKPTAVYFPPKHLATSKTLDVVIWLHGFFVKEYKFLFRGDLAKIREQVRDSGKDVVLIAPFLGYEYSVGDSVAGDYSVADLATPKWGERYLDEILAAISQFQNPDVKPPPPLQFGKLVIACHSGGGNGMRNLVGSLGKYQSNLTACWGFDCLYGARLHPDDATFWYNWLSRTNATLDIIYGPSTLPQSVKLHLMGRGLATAEGNRAEPSRPAVNNLSVSIGHYGAFPAFGQMVKVNDLDPAYVDGLMMPAKPAGAPKGKKPAGEFVQGAIKNMRDAIAFPGDIHYVIARDGFLSRLSKL
jgi:hypothetical protein